MHPMYQLWGKQMTEMIFSFQTHLEQLTKKKIVFLNYDLGLDILSGQKYTAIQGELWSDLPDTPSGRTASHCDGMCKCTVFAV